MTAGPCWIIPTELVRAWANPPGMAAFVKAAMEGADFRPHAVVQLVNRRFVATVDYDASRSPGRRQQISVQLVGVAQENAL